MRKAFAVFAVLGSLAAGGLAGCSDDDNAAAGASRTGPVGTGTIGVILPDTTSSVRWEKQDKKYLKAAFDTAGVPVDIQNAQGDRARFGQIADQMIASGVKVLMIANLDSESGKAVLDKAKAAGIKTIDYDRLTLNGGADYYVSFDNRKVGELQGQHLTTCLRAMKYRNPVVVELNGSPTDNNASDFKRGYDSVLQPLYDAASYTKGPDQWVPDWSEKDAGVIFKQMLDQQPKTKGVLAANDGIANAVIDVLRSKNLNGRVPVTGQDATAQGLQHILAGDQCMTVFKNSKPQADKAAALAIDLYKGDVPTVVDQIKDPVSGVYLPFIKLDPVGITKENIKSVIEQGVIDRAEVCTGVYQRLCTEAGI
ncbi:sugar ABC transporter substrate-binding protein [Actinoplanes sp. NPDC049265]|uniref:sugar ABC transporter substrate-binding protein n=1 Tax=Actinoplanes sp. NPDC049265 TaxID=3363902 RepID=UPI00371B4D70